MDTARSNSRYGGRVKWLWAMTLCCGCAGASAGGAPSGPGAEDFAALCDAEVRSGALEVFPFSDKASRLNEWIQQNVRDPGVRNIYFEQMPLVLSTEQGPMLEREAAKHGVRPCPLAQYVAFVVGMSYEAFSVDDCIAACVDRNAGARIDVAAGCKRGCGGDL